MVDYIVGECEPADRKRFEDHLPGCPECRKETAELLATWNSIGIALPEREVPDDWKTQIIDQAISSTPGWDSNYRTPQVATNRMDRGPMAKLAYAAAAIVIVVSCGLLAWDNGVTPLPLIGQRHVLNEPVQVVETYRLVSADSSNPGAAGKCQLLKKGKKEQLVLQVNGLPITQGDEVYQVWLIHDGKRVNAGTFKVNDEGEAGLIYPIFSSKEPFDQIGITLEPDSNGTMPRGKKVLGT
jgi:anti-sigma factor RsiW